MALTPRDRAILDFERSWWLGEGPKQGAIRSRLGLSATRYYELRASLVESPDAEAYDPLVVRRLRRRRDERRRERLLGRPAGRRSRR